jgi:hypothetical protein
VVGNIDVCKQRVHALLAYDQLKLRHPISTEQDADISEEFFSSFQYEVSNTDMLKTSQKASNFSGADVCQELS